MFFLCYFLDFLSSFSPQAKARLPFASFKEIFWKNMTPQSKIHSKPSLLPINLLSVSILSIILIYYFNSRKLVEVDGSACMLDIMGTNYSTLFFSEWNIFLFSFFSDTAGQEEYSALRDQYMKTGQGFLLVYSVTTVASFEAVTRLRTQVLRIKEDQPDIPIVLVGNKIDMDNERAVQTEQGKDLCAKWGGADKNTAFVEASAKSNVNVTDCFVELVRLINRWRANNPGEDTEKKEKRRGCVLL
jgi:small GTP-binding protein